MSRVAKNPVSLPAGVAAEFTQAAGTVVTVKGYRGSLALALSDRVGVAEEDGSLQVSPKHADKQSRALAGTTRALLQNMVIGVCDGFERRLKLNGVGYRAQAQGRKLNLTLGFSHPVVYDLPEGIEVETPSQTDVAMKGIDKQRVGQVAAEIRAIRPPEPYKGKGVRYDDERVRRKDAKKK